MSILIFIIVLAVLILVHEFGHFITAKKSGARVDEFGIGFPPKLFRLFKWGETEFTVNAIPFGGFVKIHGENPDENETESTDRSRSLAHKSRPVQALVIVAGVLFNIIFAWVLISFGYIYGLPTPVDPENPTVRPLQNPNLVITSILADSPALSKGLKAGDVIFAVKDGDKVLREINSENFSEFIDQSDGSISLSVKRGDAIIQNEIEPQSGIVENKKAIGISMSMIGILKLPVHLAIWEGVKTTISVLIAVTVGLFQFLGQIFIGDADFSQVTGPVGIVGLVGDATTLGFIFLLQFTAFISLNLAVINLLPFPALDGGRLLFLLIEAIRRKRINPKVVNVLNAAGFIALLLLMVVVTINDIVKL